MASPVEHSAPGLEAVVVRTLMECACAVVRREGLTRAPAGDYYDPSAILAAPQLTALLRALATLARVGPAWREAFDIAWLSRSLSRALSRDPPAWRGWTRGLATAPADSPSLELSLTPQQITQLLREEDSFFSAATEGDVYPVPGYRLVGPTLDLAEHSAFLRPTIAFQSRPTRVPIAFQWPPDPDTELGEAQLSFAVPSTRVGGRPQWPFHDTERCPAPPDKAQYGFVAQVNLALAKGCALANAAGLPPRDGMLYFFLQKGSLRRSHIDPGNYCSVYLRPEQCCVVHDAGSSSDEWPPPSAAASDAFAKEPARQPCSPRNLRQNGAGV